jgi:hypothetical protein
MDYNITLLHTLDAPFARLDVPADRGNVLECSEAGGTSTSGHLVTLSRSPQEVHATKAVPDLPSSSSASCRTPSALHESSGTRLFTALSVCTSGGNSCSYNCSGLPPERGKYPLVELSDRSLAMQRRHEDVPMASSQAMPDYKDRADVNITKTNHLERASMTAGELPTSRDAFAVSGCTQPCKTWMQCISLVPFGSQPQVGIR